MLKDYWLCGIGPGDAAFNLVYPKYSYSGIVAPHAHNLYLQIVCDAGIAALVIFVLLLYRFARDMCAAFCREKGISHVVYSAQAARYGWDITEQAQPGIFGGPSAPEGFETVYENGDVTIFKVTQ